MAADEHRVAGTHDLQGGASLLLQAELDQAQKDRLNSMAGDMRSNLRKALIGFSHVVVTGDTISVHILNPDQFEAAKTVLTNLNPSVGGSVLTIGSRGYDMTEAGPNTLAMKMTDAYKKQNNSDIMGQSVEVVRRRIDQLGTREPLIEQQGDDRIVVEVPGLNDPAHLVDLLGKTAKMTFQMVDDSASLDQAQKGIVPIGSELLYQDSPIKGQPPTPLVVERHVVVAGDRLVDAQAGFSQQTGEPNVSFRFDSVGAQHFGEASKENIGRRFAIVLDGKVIEAPVIRDAILGAQAKSRAISQSRVRLIWLFF